MGREKFKNSTRLVFALVFAGGCAAKQHVALDCVPHEVSVYVDGRRLEGSPDSVELRADRPHTVFFKGGDYEPRMVVLESREVDGRSELAPADVCSETSFVPMQPQVEMEIEPTD
jgi:hypothetical protein